MLIGRQTDGQTETDRQTDRETDIMHRFVVAVTHYIVTVCTYSPYIAVEFGYDFHICACVYIYIYICVCVCVCVFVLICIRKYIYIYIYIHMHTYTYAYTHMQSFIPLLQIRLLASRCLLSPT